MAEERRSGSDRRATATRTVVLVDHDSPARAALAHSLRTGGITVAGEASGLERTVELVLDVRPDVVLVNIELGGPAVRACIEQLGLLAPASRILLLARADEDEIVEAILSGASGHVLQSAPDREMIAAVTATAAGHAVLSPPIAGRLLHNLRRLRPRTPPDSDTAARVIRTVLTGRELEILALLASGQSNKQIAQQLALSSNTVANHIKSILDKLGLENRIQAAGHAIRSGIA